MGNQPVKVVMAEDTETLDEVVVVGTSMKKSDLTGAVASVSSKVWKKTGDECKSGSSRPCCRCVHFSAYTSYG